MYCKSLQINDVVTSTIKTQLHITTVLYIPSLKLFQSIHEHVKLWTF